MAGLGFAELIKRNNLEILLNKIKNDEPLAVINDPLMRIIYGNEVKIVKQPKLITNLETMVKDRAEGKTISPINLNREYLPSEGDKEEIYAKLFKRGDREAYSIKLPLQQPIFKSKEDIISDLKAAKFSEKQIKDALEKFESKKYGADIDRVSYKIDTIYTGKLLKTSDFGGKESEHALKKEKFYFDKLNSLIEAATDNGITPITIHVIDSFKKEIMLLKDVVKVIRTPGSANKPISDFEIKDKANKTIAFISHKSGKEPTDFGQYSGVSEKGRNKIFSHPETQDFGKSIKDWLYSISKRYGDGTISQFIDADLSKGTKSTNPWNDSIKDKRFGEESIYIFPRRITIAKLIVDPNLKKMAMFGQDIVDNEGKITKEKGTNAVDFLAQGMFTLTPREDGTWDLTADKIISSAEDLTSLETKYAPVFVARYEGKKANLGIAGCRISIYAQEGRNIKYYVVKEEVE